MLGLAKLLNSIRARIEWLRIKPKKAIKLPQRRLQLESLEERRLLSISAATVPPISVGASTPATVVSLQHVFTESDTTPLVFRFQVISDTNPSLFAAAPKIIEPGAMPISFSPEASGSATLTIRATDIHGQHADAMVTISLGSGEGESGGSSRSGEMLDTFSAPSAGYPTTTTLYVSPTQSYAGQQVMLTAMVVGSDPNGDIPTGNVEFYDGSTDLGGQSLDAEPQANLILNTYSTASLSSGSHSFTAVYQGDDNYAESMSAAVAQTTLESADGAPKSTSIIAAVPDSVSVDDYYPIPDYTSEFSDATGIAVGPSGNIFVTDYANNTVGVIDNWTGEYRVIAGSGTYDYAGGAGDINEIGDNSSDLESVLFNPGNLVVHGNDLYIVDTADYEIRKISAVAGEEFTPGVTLTNEITSVAGNFDGATGGDGGLATNAFLVPTSLAIDAAGDLFIGEYGDVREVDHNTGIITTIAGNGTMGAGGDGGLAIDAGLGYVSGLAVDAQGNVFIADNSNNVVREITKSDGRIWTVAGNGRESSAYLYDYSGDGGPAVDAELSVSSVSIDADGNLFIGGWGQDYGVVREVDHVTGIITTVAGDNGYGGWPDIGTNVGDDGPAFASSFYGPSQMSIDLAGDVYFVDDSETLREILGLVGDNSDSFQGSTTDSTPTFTVGTYLEPTNGTSALSSVTAVVSMQGTDGTAVTSYPTDVDPAQLYDISASYNVSSFATGFYPWTMTLTETYSDSSTRTEIFTGYHSVLHGSAPSSDESIGNPVWPPVGLVIHPDGTMDFGESTTRYTMDTWDEAYDGTSDPVANWGSMTRDSTWTAAGSNIADSPAGLIPIATVVDQSASSALTDGSLVLPVAAAGLNYISQSQEGQTFVSVDTELDTTDPHSGYSLTGVTVSGMLGGFFSGQFDYSTSVLGGGDASDDTTYRFTVPFTASWLASGRYATTVTITENYSDGEGDTSSQVIVATGWKDVLNRNHSIFGPGWNLDTMDALAPSPPGGPNGVSFVGGDGTMGFFWQNADGSYSSENGPFHFDTLTGDWSSGFTLKRSDGTEETFDYNGTLQDVYDPDGNDTHFASIGGGFEITDPQHNNTTYDISGGLVDSITDFATRVTSLDYDGNGLLIDIKLPSPDGIVARPETDFGYTLIETQYGNVDLTSVQDAISKTTSFAYDTASNALNTVTYSDGTSTYQYQAAMTFPLDSGGDLTLASDVKAIATDQAAHPTTYTLDSFGGPLTILDSLGHTTTFVRNSDGQATEMDQPAVLNGGSTPVSFQTLYSYDTSSGKLNQETLPDSTTETWVNTSISLSDRSVYLPTSYTQVDSDSTQPHEKSVYSYASGTGDLTSTQHYANGTSANSTNDPVTNTVYTTSSTSGDPPLGLVSSTEDADGRVSAFIYDTHGDTTATFAGQIVPAPGGGGTSWTFAGLAPGASRTYDIFVQDSDPTYTVTVDGHTLGPSGSTILDASAIGSSWTYLRTVTLPSGIDPTAPLVVTSDETSSGSVCVMQAMSTMVYSSQQDLASTTDAMGHISATGYDTLDRPISTAQGQTVVVDATTGKATFNNVPQTPGMTRLIQVYVNSTTHTGYSFSDTLHSSGLSFDTTGAGSSPWLGSGWYFLGTLSLGTSDTSSTVNVAFATAGTPIALLQQTGTAFYDAVGDVLSQTDGLNRTSISSYNDLEQHVFTWQGQIVATASNSATFNNLTQTPGQARTYMVYVKSPTLSDTAMHPSDNLGDTITTSFVTSANTALGSGWYQLGTVTIGSSDASSSLTFGSLASSDTQICIVQQVWAGTYTQTGMLYTEQDALGNETTYGYDALNQQTLVTGPAPDPSAPTVRPQTTDVYDAIGRNTSETDPLGHVVAYAYSDFGRTVATWQGQVQPPNSSTSTTWTFSNLPLANDIAGGSAVDRVYNVYVEGSSIGLTVNHGTWSYPSSHGLDASALGSDWTWIGTVTLSGSDTNTSLTFTHSGSTSLNVCLMQKVGSQTVNADGNTTSQSDPLGNTTSYVYSALGPPVQPSITVGGVSKPLGPTFDKAGNTVTDTELKNGYITDYFYNMLGDHYKTIQPNPSGGSEGGGPVTQSVFNAIGQLVGQIDPLGNVSTFGFDAFGNQVTANEPIPTSGSGGGPGTTSVLDLDGELVQSIDALGNITAFSYDAFGNQVSRSDPDPANGQQDGGSPVTSYVFDADGNTVSLVDSVGNRTSWTFDGLGRELTQTETVALGYTTSGTLDTTSANYSYQYDLDNNVVKSTDADLQVITYRYDWSNNEVGETWFTDSSDASSNTDPLGTYTFTFDVDGNLSTASNNAAASRGASLADVASYIYQYDTVGNWTAQQITLGGVAEDVVLHGSYNNNGDQESLAANIGGTLTTYGTITGGINDFADSFTFDAIGRMTDAVQTSQSGTHNGVTDKHVTFSYDLDSRLDTVDRFQNASGTSNEVVSSTYGFDHASRLTSLTYVLPSGSTDTPPAYTWLYDDDNRVTNEYSAKDASGGYTTGETDYIYDATSQLTTTNYVHFSNDPSSNKVLQYDSNGNRTTTTSLTPGTESPQSGTNRMLFDGTYYYQYDANGNRIAKWIDNSGHPEGSPQTGDTDVTLYVWNVKNELVSAKHYTTFGGAADETDYASDAFGRMVTHAHDGDPAEHFVYDGRNVALVLDDNGQVMERELFGPAVDQVLATEYVTANGTAGTTQSAGTTNWALPDDQLTIRDIAIYNVATGTTSIKDHMVYDPFGQMTHQTNSDYQPQFAYDGMWLDPVTGLSYAGSGSWYDAVDAVFAGGDPGGARPLANNPGSPSHPPKHPKPNNPNKPVDPGDPPPPVPEDNFLKAFQGQPHSPGFGEVVGMYGQPGGSGGGGTAPVPTRDYYFDPINQMHFADLNEMNKFAKSRRHNYGLRPREDGAHLSDGWDNFNNLVSSFDNTVTFGGYNNYLNGLNANFTDERSGWSKAGNLGGDLVLGVLGGELGGAGLGFIGDMLGGGAPEAFSFAADTGTAFGDVDADANVAIDTLRGAEAEDSFAAQCDGINTQCFPAGTLVATATGNVAIETIRIGNEVWAYDLVAGKWRLCKVLQTFVHDFDGKSATLLVEGETIESTDGHPFWVVRGEDLGSRHCAAHAVAPQGATTPGRWVSASDLRVGDDVLLRDGRIVPVQDVRVEPFQGKVYNFSVAELESYAVGRNNVLVHNLPGECFGSGGGHFIDDWKLYDEFNNPEPIASSDEDGVWSGLDRSLDPGKRLSWPEQFEETHTEGKVISELEDDGMLAPGRRLEMSGFDDPCGGCQSYIAQKSAQYQMNMMYRNEANDIWAWASGQLIVSPM